MTGIMCAMAGIGPSGGSSSREPASGDYYDANNRVTYTTVLGVSPPFSSYTQVVFRWGGVNVVDSGAVPYPAVSPNQATSGAYTYYMGAQRTNSGSDPNFATYGIYREG